MDKRIDKHVEILYFSGTGNSLVVARDLAKSIGEVNLQSLKALVKSKREVSTDHLGIVFPLYNYGIPLIVERFIKTLRPNPDSYIFAIMTYGDFKAGGLVIVDNLLKKQGLRLSAGFGICMPGNYPPAYGAISKRRQNKMFAKEKLKIFKISDVIANRQSCRIEKDFLLIRWFFSGLLYRIYKREMPTDDRHFWTDDRCNGCGNCSKVCPVNNIRIENEGPVWQGRCEVCFACLQWCSKESVQYGSRTEKRKRYTHPAITFSDIVDEDN